MELMLRIGMLAAFVAGPMLNSLHLAHEAEHAVCEACGSEVRADGSVAVRCAGGCGEADHHHHAPAHRHESCAICKASAGAIASTGYPAPAVPGSGWLSISFNDRIPSCRDPSGSSSPRAPPALS